MMTQILLPNPHPSHMRAKDRVLRVPVPWDAVLLAGTHAKKENKMEICQLVLRRGFLHLLLESTHFRGHVTQR